MNPVTDRVSLQKLFTIYYTNNGTSDNDYILGLTRCIGGTRSQRSPHSTPPVIEQNVPTKFTPLRIFPRPCTICECFTRIGTTTMSEICCGPEVCRG